MGLYKRKKEESAQEETKVIGLLPRRKIFLSPECSFTHRCRNGKAFGHVPHKTL